ncbi:DUF6098 family protein [Microbacterium sp. M3]|uniref:DUF6098 family protein n=1 Tax=Microbacterium arthrosphaerae TaxID=792652 RepID=A0ABU4GXZ6_9MICO|nr:MULTISPECIES: DUF6098 family protein [Microbacterium]MDW4571952.1 DUF6098 family protein [Microbacterium arthrosphaerae]MDW7605807.1 DUF6098 family protein [Microbacterium sp. M3]
MTVGSVRAARTLFVTETMFDSITSLAELAETVRRYGRLYVRYSEGPQGDREGSVDTESGLPLPGLSANPLHAQPWWTRELEDWLARQVCQYRELAEKNPDRFAWVLSGTEAGRGPDCEPLVRAVVPIAKLDPALLDEAAHRYETRFDAGHGPED